MGHDDYLDAIAEEIEARQRSAHLAALEADFASALQIIKEAQVFVREAKHTDACWQQWDRHADMQVCTCNVAPLRSKIATFLKNHQ